MNAGNQLRALLAGDGAVTALVDTRIAADRIEQADTRPFLIYTKTGSEPQYSLDGTQHGERVLLEIQIWADRRVEADEVRDAVVAALAGDQRNVISETTGYDAELDLEAAILSVEWWD